MVVEGGQLVASSWTSSEVPEKMDRNYTLAEAD
jgi:hypothetical protein